MKQHIVLDTAEILICDACQSPIASTDDKIIFGVGAGVYVKVFHRKCDSISPSNRTLVSDLSVSDSDSALPAMPSRSLIDKRIRAD